MLSNIRGDTKGYYKSCLINSNDDLKVVIPDEELWPIYNDLITNYYKKTFLQETKGFSKNSLMFLKILGLVIKYGIEKMNY